MGALPILTYHSLDTSGSVVSVAPRVFADHMACLADLGVKGMTLRAAVACRHRTGSWPAGSVVLTFDDGYANLYGFGLPVLAQRGFTATVFLVTRHVGGRNDWAPLPAGLGTHAMLSWQQVAELSAAGMEIGVHTRTHPDLRRLCTPAVEEEIVAARREVEERLHQRVESFAYPFGSVSRAAQAIAQREFRAACTTVLKRAEAEPEHELPRVDAYYIQSTGALQRLVHGQLDRYLTLRRWARAAHRGLPGRS